MLTPDSWPAPASGHDLSPGRGELLVAKSGAAVSFTLARSRMAAAAPISFTACASVRIVVAAGESERFFETRAGAFDVTLLQQRKAQIRQGGLPGQVYLPLMLK